MAKVSNLFHLHLKEDESKEEHKDSSQSKINYKTKTLDHAFTSPLPSRRKS